jgi:hypothetical protein
MLNMSHIIDKITDRDNLLWAWGKAKNAYQIGDIWFDEIDLATFESNLNSELNLIKEEILSRCYNISQIKPIPYPKGFDEINGKPRTRQTFWINVRDQVVWLAVINIIGPELDWQMPSWSYGHRLYLSIWYNEIENGKHELKFGWYRNSSGKIYRKWSQSWPLFRRHISLTTKIMSRSNEFYVDPKDFVNNVITDESEKNDFRK